LKAWAVQVCAVCAPACRAVSSAALQTCVNLQPFRASHLLARARRLSPCSCKWLVRGLGKPGETLCASMSPFVPKPCAKCLMRLESGVPLGSASVSKNLALVSKLSVPAVSRRAALMLTRVHPPADEPRPVSSCPLSDFNQRVLGSSPSAPTNKKKDLRAGMPRG